MTRNIFKSEPKGNNGLSIAYSANESPPGVFSAKPIALRWSGKFSLIFLMSSKKSLCSIFQALLERNERLTRYWQANVTKNLAVFAVNASKVLRNQD